MPRIFLAYFLSYVEGFWLKDIQNSSGHLKIAI